MNILKNIFKKDTQTLSPMEQKVETVQAVIDKTEESDEIAHQNAIQVAIEQIRSDPDMDTGKFAKMLLENSSFTSSDIQTLAIELASRDSEKSALKIVQETPLSTGQIQKIVAKAPVSLDTAEEMIKEIPDEKIQQKEQEKINLEREQKTLDQLSKLYKSCDDIESNKILSLINALDIQDITPSIQKKLVKIVAKRAALDCMKYGICRYEPLSKIVSSEELFEEDLPSLVNIEYKHLKVRFDDEEKTYYKFTPERKQVIYEKILEDLAKKSAQTFNYLSDFGIPKTDKFKNLSEADIKFFVENVKVYSPGISKAALKRLSRQLNGEAAAELHDLNRILEKMNSKDKDIVAQNIISGIIDTSLLKDTSQTSEVDIVLFSIIAQIKNLPKEDQLPTAQTIKDTLNERQKSLKLVKNIRKVNVPVPPHSGSTNGDSGGR